MPYDPPDSLRRAWTAAALRRFRWMLALVVGLFVATEAAARLEIVAHLRPLSLHTVATNILFAIGFGSPVVLYLSGLPPLGEALGVLAVGGALTLALGAAVGTPGVPQAVIGLGLGCLLMLGWRTVRRRDEQRTTALLYLLPSMLALAYTLLAGLFLDALPQAIPYTFDSLAYVADSGFGFQPSFAMGKLFAAVPPLAWVCFAIYTAPPPILAFVYTLQLRARRAPPIDAITVLLVLGLIGYALYFVYPVCGPLFAFGSAFPNQPPSVEPLMGGRIFVEPVHASHPAWRNAMPSLHLGSVLLAVWHARPYGRVAWAVSVVILAGTALATLGLGEHYLVDLVVALPFTLAVHAACTPRHAAYAGERRRALAGGVGLVALWYAFLFWGTSLLHASHVLAWSLSLATLGIVVALERALYRSAYLEPPPAPAEADRGPRVAERIAPGPPAYWPTGHLLPFRRDPLALFAAAQNRYGDVVRFRLGTMPVHLVAHPDHVRHVLVTNQRNYDKATRSSAQIRGVIGDSLLTSNGDAWLAERRSMQPAFKPQSVGAFAGAMVDATEAMLRRWESHAAAGRRIDVAAEMMGVTYTIVGKSLFGADVSAEVDAVADAATRVTAHTYRRVEWLVHLPLWLPTPDNLAFRRATAQLDALVYRIIDDRQLRSGNDLVSLLLRRPDAETVPMTRRALRNQVLTLLLAGHETTANALTWTWYLLATHPLAARKALIEATEVLDGRRPVAADLDRLPWITAVIREAMRLYPPIWIIERHAREEDDIGGYRIPAGSSVLISPWVTHRHRDVWDDAERFVPERFLGEGGGERHPFAYIPFGGGQRQCIGNHFALMEAQVIVAMVAQRFRLDLAGQTPIVPQPGITLRCRHGLPIYLRTASEDERMLYKL